MYLDHPTISATNSGTEPDRVERVNRVYGYAVALADVDGNRECITKLEKLHDHKGNLVVTWRVAPTAREKTFLTRAWQSQVGDQTDSVSHEMNQAPV